MVPSSFSSRMIRKMSSTMRGARPREGSSIRRSFGRAIRAREMASICCSPPERVPAFWVDRSSSTGKRANIAFTSRSTLAASLREYAPARRFSSTVMSGNTSRFSGTRAMPRSTIWRGARPAISSPRRVMEPRRGLRIPAMVIIRVVLPAPFGPRRHVISPSAAARFTPLSASMLP